MDILEAVKRKLKNLAGGVVSSVKSSIPKVSSFIQQSPAEFLSKQFQTKVAQPIAQKTYQTIGNVGKTLQKIPQAPDIVGPTFMGASPFGPIQQAPGYITSYLKKDVGKLFEDISTPQGREKLLTSGKKVIKQPFKLENLQEPAVNALLTAPDFLPGGFLFAGGVKAIARKGAKELGEKAVKEVGEKTLRSSLANFDEAVDVVRKRLGTPDEQIKAIDTIYKIAQKYIPKKEMDLHKTVDDVIEAIQGRVSDFDYPVPKPYIKPEAPIKKIVPDLTKPIPPFTGREIGGATGGVPKVEPVVFQKDLDRFTALVKQNDKYQQGIPAIGKLPSSQQVADQMGIPHEQFMDQVLGRAGKPVERLPATPAEVIPPKTPPLPATPESVISVGTKERGVLKTIRTAEVTTPELKQGIETISPETRYYKPYSDTKSLTDAQSMIATDGIDTVKQTILKGEYNKTNVAAAEILISKAMNEGRIEEATQMLKDLSVKATTSGQANQAWSMWSRLTPEGMLKYAVKEVLNANEKMGAATKFVRKTFGKKAPEITAEDATIITDLMKKANAATTDAERAKFVKLALQTISDKIPLGVSEVIDAYRYNNMLSGLPTHERNFFYNVWNTFITPAMTLVAEGKPREAVKYELNAIKAIPKGMDAFVKTMTRQLPIDLSKVEIKNVRFQKLPRAITVFSELMEASDKMNSAIIEAAEMGRGKTLSEAQKTAEYYLLRKPIGIKGAGLLSDSIDSMAQGIEAFGRKFKPVRWAVPFLRTPFNAAKMWLEYSPVGVANMIGSTNKRIVLAKALLGSGATMIGAKLALEGRTTWSVPVDKDQKDWFYATKRKPFSVQIGDKWIPSQYFGPFAFALLLPAAANYYYNEAPKALTDGDMGKLGKTLASILYFWSQSSPMANLGGFVKTMEGDIDFSVPRNLAFTISQLKPYEGMLRYIASIFDPIYRKPATFGEQMITDIPFLSATIPGFYKEPTGEPSVRGPINYLLPWGIGTAKPEYETYYQGRTTELQTNALETQLKNAYTEGKPLPPNVSLEMKADLLYSELKKAVDKKDTKLVEKIKNSGLATPEVKAQAQKYQALEKLGIMKADRDLLQFDGAARAAEALKRIETLSPKNQAKHLKLLVDAKIVTPEVLAEMKKLYKKK